MDVSKLEKDFAAFVAEHGREPEILICDQWSYINIVYPESHTDFDGGTDIRYQSALVVVDGSVGGWRFG